MKRLTKQILGAIVTIALAGAAVAFVVWAAATTPGSRWVLATVSSLSGVHFSAQNVEGSIADHLRLTGVRLALSQQKIELDTLELRWKPLLLLSGTVALKELTLNGVRIQDDSPTEKKPSLPAWPKVSKNAQLLDILIERLQIQNLSYRRLHGQPLQVKNIACSAAWQEGALSIHDLDATSPSGQIHGSLSAGFNTAYLTADLALALTQPVAGMDRFLLKAERGRSMDSEQLADAITVAGSAGKRKVLEVSGDVGLGKSSLNLRRIRLTRPGQKGVITADGALAFTNEEPLLTVQVKGSGLDLAPELNVPTNLSGTVTFAGTIDKFRGDISIANQAVGWQAATVSATYHGTREGMKLAPLNARILDGTLAGNLEMDWRDGFALQGTIRGTNLNPAIFAPDWKGVANFTATGKLARSGNAPFSGSVSGRLLESSLHGQALTGEVKADFSDNNLYLTRLALQGKGFTLLASGDLDERLTIAAQISDVSRLVPGSAGKLQADGWVRWHDRRPSGAIVGTGSKLSYRGTQVAAATFSARLLHGAGYPLHASATLRNVVSGGYTLNAVTVALDGTLPRHTMNATVRSSDAEAGLTLAAGYNAGIWKGEITRLAARERGVTWNLTTPAQFAVSADKVSLSPLSLSAGAAGRLEIAADLALNPLKGQLRAELSGIDLARLKPWFPPDTVLAGRISGMAKANMLPGQNFEMDGSASISGGTLRRQRPEGETSIAFKSATVLWGWRGETLSGSLSLAMAEYGQLRGDFRVPIPARFPLAANTKGPLRASLTGHVKEKGIITALFPGLIRESHGDLTTELDIGGTWEKPRVAGKLRLTKAGAYLPTAGIHLKDVQLAAHLDKNLILIDSFRALSGPGYIEGTAQITLSGWQVTGYQGTIRGDNFQTVHFPELRILSSPNLRFEGTAQKLMLRGEVRLPELNIVGTQARTTIAPSGDVILEGKIATPTKSSPPLDLDVQVKVLLGDKVLVKVAGVDAQLGGAVDLSFNDLNRINSRGEIKVVKGRYRTYGVDLEIVRGRLFFAGDTINRPSLDFLALRTIGNVRAGVTVTGTLQRPITKLYSEPPMPDVDILAYIVLGHPLGSNSQQASLVTQAAGALLTSGQSAVLQNQIKNKLGLSTLEIQGGVGGTANSMGYSPLPATAPGAIPATQQPGITETMLTVGKYLTPELYISYGKSLFTGSNLFRLRYDIFKQWQIETQTGGGESGVDLFYKLEFK